ncbi:hypothetical protein ILS92_09225 [Acinetobacter baumannii]|nr:hypothetical protein [Acinetobacter baumannii]HCW5913658.1 hypothetical protein [Acinetobacter baumannii]
MKAHKPKCRKAWSQKMFAIIDSQSNVLTTSICKIKIEDIYFFQKSNLAHNFGCEVRNEMQKDLTPDDLNDEETCINLDLGYLSGYNFKEQEFEAEHKIAHWDSKQAKWI